MKEKQRRFHGNWITSDEFCGLRPVNVFHRQLEKADIPSKAPQNRHILFRNRFTALTDERVIIYISADDYYKLYINGEFVCQGPSPGYPFHYYYNTVDISGYVRRGGNTIAVHTYYQGLINRVWVSGDDRHGLILDIMQGDGLLLSSDESFLYEYHSGFSAIGEYGYSTQFAEKYTSGTEQEGFYKPDYNDSGWKKARKREHADYQLFAQPTAQLVFEDIKPCDECRDAGGVTFDFGKVFVGYLKAEAEGKPGDEAELLFGQELNEDGSVRWKLRANCNYRELWQLSGGEDSLNEFDYKSFRYVRVNLPKGCSLKNVSLIARHYPFELKAKPNTDDEELLKIWELCVNSLKYGTQEVIQDCMEREKGSYLGDGCYTALAHAILTRDTAVFKKLMDDSLRSSFINNGLMTCSACSFMQEIAEYPLMMVYAIYCYYKLTGDTGYLKEKYRSLCKVLDYYRDSYMQEDGLISNLDKWCVVEWPAEYRDGYDADIAEGRVCNDVHNVINAHYIGAVKYLNKIASCIGFDKYCDEKPLMEAYMRTFYLPKRKLFKDNARSEHISIMSNVFALMYDLCPDSDTEESIIALVRERGFTRVMLFGAFPILAGLKRLGRKDLMYAFLKDDGAWKRMLREGATATFEGWGKDSKWNTSLFHLTLSYASIFLTDWEKYGDEKLE